MIFQPGPNWWIDRPPGRLTDRYCHEHSLAASMTKNSLLGKLVPTSLEHSSFPKAKSKPRHEKHYQRAFHSTLFQMSHFGRFSSEVPRTLNCLALHRQMKLPSASGFYYRTHTHPGMHAKISSSSSIPYATQWTHPSLQGMGPVDSSIS